MKRLKSLNMEAPSNYLYVKTGDGSISLRDQETGEWYHNSAGAFEESKDNYAVPALYLLERLSGQADRQSVKLLDICFGLGYNSFSLINQLLKEKIALPVLEIHAVELDKSLLPVMAETLEQNCFERLNQANFVTGEEKTCFKNFFKAENHSSGKVIKAVLKPENESAIKEIHFNLYFEDLRIQVPSLIEDHEKSFDLVFHDPFSPNKKPQFWTEDLFSCYRTLLKDNVGILLTYSIASAVRGGLIESGFSVYRTKAVGVKNGGTLGIADSIFDPGKPYSDFVPSDTFSLTESLSHDESMFFALDEDEVGRLMFRSGIPYRDPGFNLSRKAIIRNRQIEQDI